MSFVEFEFTRRLWVAAAIGAADGAAANAANAANATDAASATNATDAADAADAADGTTANAAIYAAVTVSRAGRSDVWLLTHTHASSHAGTYTYSKLSTCSSSAIRSPTPTIPTEPGPVRKECGDSSNGHAKQHLQEGESADGKHGILPNAGSDGGHSAERVRLWNQSGRQ